MIELNNLFSKVDNLEEITIKDLKKIGNKYNVNMTKIESRPSKEKPWEYLFFVDFEGHQRDAKVRKALAELEEHSTRLTILGSYPKAPSAE